MQSFFVAAETPEVIYTKIKKAGENFLLKKIHLKEENDILLEKEGHTIVLERHELIKKRSEFWKSVINDPDIRIKLNQAGYFIRLCKDFPFLGAEILLKENFRKLFSNEDLEKFRKNFEDFSPYDIYNIGREVDGFIYHHLMPNDELRNKLAYNPEKLKKNSLPDKKSDDREEVEINRKINSGEFLFELCQYYCMNVRAQLTFTKDEEAKKWRACFTPEQLEELQARAHICADIVRAGGCTVS